MRYPLGEICGAATIVWPLAHFGPGVDAALAAIFLSFLLVASAIDLQRPLSFGPAHPAADVDRAAGET